jgi:hypothetical protein
MALETSKLCLVESHNLDIAKLKSDRDIAQSVANDTTRRNPICGAPFRGLVAHLACATHIKPQVTFICGARLCAPRIGVIPMAHPSTCATHSLCGAPKGGAPRIGCATDIKIGAPQICFPFYFFRKYSRNTHYTAKNIQYTVQMQRYTHQ